MSKKIIIAGAGHGGLTAAALMAKAGLDVTVIEKNEEGKLGYDWYDALNPAIFALVGCPHPNEAGIPWKWRADITYFGPSTTDEHKIPQYFGKQSDIEIIMERSDIYKLLAHPYEGHRGGDPHRSDDAAHEYPSDKRTAHGSKCLDTGAEIFHARLCFGYSGLDPTAGDGLGIAGGSRLIDLVAVQKKLFEVFGRELPAFDGLPQICSGRIEGYHLVKIDLSDALGRHYELLAQRAESESFQ